MVSLGSSRYRREDKSMNGRCSTVPETGCARGGEGSMRLNLLPTRRRLLQTPAAGIGVLFLTDGCTHPSIALRPGEGPPPDGRDPLMVALAYALLAPSPHNAQSGRIELRRPREVSLAVDRERLLPASDPLARQVHLGQGTFLELLDLAAREQGFHPRIEYFPSDAAAGPPGSLQTGMIESPCCGKAAAQGRPSSRKIP